jgi:diaminopimelate epimerase
MKFHKYQALGNDYLVLDVAEELELTPAVVRRICNRHLGIGADGILVGVRATGGKEASLRIFNPDGSEAEKSGNGLRIFARYLWDAGRVAGDPFVVITQGGMVRCQVRDAGRQVFVEMGTASFNSTRIPVAGPEREVIAEQIEIAGEKLRFTAVTVGNPHCVIHGDEISSAQAQRLGPAIENHPLFPNRVNVQFVKVLDRRHIQIEIWERGTGYTLASGSSSCAAAAVSFRLGLCGGELDVSMPGGTLQVAVSADFAITMLGPVSKIAEGMIAGELLGEAG